MGACVTTKPGAVTIEDLNMPLADLQAVVSGVMPEGLLRVSQNEREFFSNFFVIANQRTKPAGNSNVRFYAHILVLGDRRPYNIKTMVKEERRPSANGEFREVAIDKRMSLLLSQLIQKRLSKRPSDRNVIDDFRVF